MSRDSFRLFQGLFLSQVSQSLSKVLFLYPFTPRACSWQVWKALQMQTLCLLLTAAHLLHPLQTHAWSLVNTNSSCVLGAEPSARLILKTAVLCFVFCLFPPHSLYLPSCGLFRHFSGFHLDFFVEFPSISLCRVFLGHALTGSTAGGGTETWGGLCCLSFLISGEE